MNKAMTGIETLDDTRLDIFKKDGKLALTEEQGRAVLAEGRIIVSAAAGSGKTSTMVKRILRMIADGVALKDMLILVYNTAAADELKERLHEGLFELACTADGELRDRLRREIDELPFCHISTIHAFCSTLIRDNFDKLGLSPTFEVLDETAHAVYKNRALDDVFEAYSQRDDAVFDNIAEIFSKARREDNLRTNIIKLHGIIEIQPDRESFLKSVGECFESFEDSAFMKRLEEFYKSFFESALCKLSENLPLIDSTSVEKYKEGVRIEIALCKQMLSAHSFKEMCVLADTVERPALGTRSRKLTEDEKRISNVTKAYIDEIGKVQKELAGYLAEFDRFKVAHSQNRVYIDKIIALTLDFDKRLNELKLADNVLSFEDLQKFAAELLEDEPSLGKNYAAVFVDEYQDVNPTQENIIERLIVGDGCFMVGDVKQSIYGFRLADPSIFIARKERYASGDGVAIDFNRNFRSTRAILSFVNAVFDVVMTKGSAQVDYKNEGAFELDGTPEEGYVQVHLFVDKKADAKTADGLYDITCHEQEDEDVKASEYEGRFIAKEIKSLVGHALVDGREMRFGDVAILFRSRTRGARLIIEQLKAAGIPIEEGAFAKSASRPERELVCMLRVLDNPRQDVPLAGYLLSFFGGYKEEELAEVAMEEGDCFYDRLLSYCQKDVPLAARLRQTLKTLDNYRVKASFKSVAELMNGIVSDFCYDAYLMKSGEADVYGLKGFIAGVATQDGKSLGRFLDEYCETGDAKGCSGGGDRVHISTFHGYKGLEIPVAFVADCACGFNIDPVADMVALNNGYIGLRYFDFENKHKFNTLSKLAVSKLAKRQQIREEMRLFYVALTRAKQLMYVTASVNKKQSEEFGEIPKIGLAGCDLDFISSAICAGEVKAFRQLHASEEFADGQANDTHLILPENAELTSAILGARQTAYPYEEATHIAMKYSVSALDGDDTAVRVYEDGANVGTTYHKVMQYIDFGVSGVDGVRAELARMRDENILADDEAELIDTSIIARCLDSEIMQIAREAERMGGCAREKSFMMYKPANTLGDSFKTDDKVLVQGIIDLFINSDKKILVDFKYSRLDDEKLKEKYKKQLYLYKTAIESALLCEIDRIVIYSFISGSCIDLDID